MKSLRVSATVTFILGCFSALCLIFQFLALTDIFHQEPNLVLEWKVVQFCYLTQLLFIISTFITLGFMVKTKYLFSDKLLQRN